MKLLNVLFAVLFVSGNCWAGEYNVANSTASLVVRHYSLRHPKRGIRKDGKPDTTDIKPIAQASGIDNGLVVVYGHIINPPYKFSVDDSVISINAVPVGEMSTENAVLSAKAADLIEKADSLFCDAKNKNNGGAKAAEILALFESNTEVVISAEWVGNEPPPKGVLIVKWKNGVRRPDVHFNNSICDSPALRAANGQYGTAMERRKESNRDAIFLQKALEQGNVLFFASDGSELTLPITAKSSIAEIIKNENSGRKELIEKLMKLGFSHRGATDLIRNYTPD